MENCTNRANDRHDLLRPLDSQTATKIYQHHINCGSVVVSMGKGSTQHTVSSLSTRFVSKEKIRPISDFPRLASELFVIYNAFTVL